MDNFFEMMLRRKDALLLQPKDITYVQNEYEKAYLVAAVGNMISLGFEPSVQCIRVLSAYSLDEMKDLVPMMMFYLRKKVGGNVQYNPMYPNFPEQVAEASDVELFFNAIVHYATFGLLKPYYVEDPRPALKEAGKLRILNLGKKEDVVEMIQNLLNSPTSLSSVDVCDFKIFIENYEDYSTVLPETIPFKENVAVVTAMMFLSPDRYGAAGIGKYVKTATDVLRMITAASGGDVSLARNCKYDNLDREHRRMVMDLLANCGKIDEDLFRYRQKWLRIGEIVHPFEFKAGKYQGVVKAFDMLRNQHKPQYFNGAVEAYIINKDVDGLVKLLSKRPTEFARRLDKILRDNPARSDDILDAFAQVAKEVSTPVLLNLREFYRHRNEKKVGRFVFPKGMLAKVEEIEQVEVSLDEAVCRKLVDVCTAALLDVYKTREPMGKVYVDESLRDIVVPFGQRSASGTSKIVTRGSRFALDAKTVRGFIWWTDTRTGNRVDVDLSAELLNKDWEYVAHISFTHLREGALGYHSGDIVNGGDFDGEGVAEFIDLNVDECRKAGARYAVFMVFCYTSQPFNTLEHAAFGWMNREEPNSGEIFEPRTVEMKMSLTTDGNMCLPVVYDFEEKTFIWADLSGEQFGLNMLETTQNKALTMAKATVYMQKPNLYDLVCLNAQARGELAETPEEADIVFGKERVELPVAEEGEPEKAFVSAYDIDYIVGNLL